MITKNGIIQGKEFNESFGEYTIVGEPTITDTVLSGCSKTDYLLYAFSNPPRTSESVITFCGSFIVPNQRTVFWTVNNDYWRIRLEATSATQLNFTNSSWAGIKFDFSDILTEGDKVYYRASITDGAQTLKVYKDDVEVFSGTSSHSNGTWNVNGEYVKISTICFGGYSGSYISNTSNGLQDLADFIVLVNEEPIYAPIINKATFSEYQVSSTEFYEI